VLATAKTNFPSCRESRARTAFQACSFAEFGVGDGDAGFREFGGMGWTISPASMPLPQAKVMRIGVVFSDVVLVEFIMTTA
jgi:hypothetical protein